MKKLMIAAAIVCVAAASQAATIAWQFSNPVYATTIDAKSTAPTAYLIDASKLTQAQIYSAIVNDSKTLEQAIGDNYLLKRDLTNATFTKVTGAAWPTGKGYADEMYVTAYAVLFDSSLNALYFTDQQNKGLSSSQDSKYTYQNAMSIQPIAADMSTFEATKGGWVATAAVPEPTSGLLLLLGVAGLALKRRRA